MSDALTSATHHARATFANMKHQTRDLIRTMLETVITIVETQIRAVKMALNAMMIGVS